MLTTRDSLGSCRWSLLCLSAVVVIGVSRVASAADAPLEYNRDIRPILAENCFACHGPDSASRKGELRLDKREAVIEKKAVVPGKVGESELVKRILSLDADEVMPPVATKKKLTTEQKDILKRWVEQGAEYQQHWSFLAPTRPALPVVKSEAWVKNPIDRFVLAKLEAAGLSPAPEADRRTLARRLSLDIIGLPPAPEVVEQFVADQSPNAYEKLVDRLMESKHWGEHRGRYWLDAARYADTHGIHFDNYRENWAYRAWVIEAFNRNMPFDQFTVEQLAGDLMPNRTLDQQVASGFNRCNITSSEGGAIAEEYLVLYNRDRTETTSQVWLGMTAGCAVCHDHKFDPLSQKEFYELAAFFNNTTQAAMDGNIKDTPPVIVVPQPEDRPKWEAVSKDLADAKKLLEGRKQEARPDFDTWLAAATPEQFAASTPSDKLALHAPFDEGKGEELSVTVAGQTKTLAAPKANWIEGHVGAKALKIQPETLIEWPEVGDFDINQAFSCGMWVKIQKRNVTGSLIARMEEADTGHRGWDIWLEGGRIGMHVVSKWPEDAMKTVATTEVKVNEWHHVLVTCDGSGKAEGLKIYYDGAPQPTTNPVNVLKSTTRTKVPLKLAQRTSSSRVNDFALQDLRVYEKALDPSEVQRLARSTRAASLALKPADKRSDTEKNELFDWWLTALDPKHQELQAQANVLQAEEATLRGRGTIAHVMQEKGEGAMAFVLYRGEYDKRRDQVKPSTPAVLPAWSEDQPRNRLGLANWLLRPEHPLTARVTANRFWQELFGRGLVRTSEDFGVSGDLPSNQELLDWLAIEFREGTPSLSSSPSTLNAQPSTAPWDIKRFYKLLVTSATYRQSAVVTKEKLERDPANKLLSRGPRFRMDAEMIRDYALASSGLLVPKLGGPSVKPYQPEGVWEAVAMIGSNTRDYKRDTGESLYRRSLYTFIKRSAPPASMEIFNATAREQCTVRRERTNTPLQALVTLNDVQFIEAARHLAQTVLKSGGTTEQQLDQLSKILLARSFRPNELPVVQSSLADLTAYYRDHETDAKALITTGESKPDAALDAKTLAAWTMLANEVMNLDEVLNK